MAGTKRSGRKRKPTEMRVIEGTFRKDRHGAAPEVEPGFPEAPAHLTERQKQLWVTFPRRAWITESDWMQVNGAVALFDLVLRNQDAQGKTEDAGNMLILKQKPDPDGGMHYEPAKSPLISQAAELWASFLRTLPALGLTPADRAKMQAPKQEAVADKWAGIL
jgi:hypothetical protein